MRRDAEAAPRVQSSGSTILVCLTVVGLVCAGMVRELSSARTRKQAGCCSGQRRPCRLMKMLARCVVSSVGCLSCFAWLLCGPSLSIPPASLLRGVRVCVSVLLCSPSLSSPHMPVLGMLCSVVACRAEKKLCVAQRKWVVCLPPAFCRSNQKYYKRLAVLLQQHRNLHVELHTTVLVWTVTLQACTVLVWT